VLLPRIGAAAGALLALAALAKLSVSRPALPHVPSLTGPVTATAVQEVALCLAWLLAVYVAFAVLVKATRVVVQGPAWQRDAKLPGVIPSPPPPRPHTPLADRFQPRFPITPALRPHTDASAPAAGGQVAVAVAVVGQARIPARPADTQPRTPALLQGGQPARSAPNTSVLLLGPLRIDGTEHDIRRAPTRELIAYLALHPRGANRDELTDALWPQLDAEAARKRLWQSATDARRALGDAWVRDGERYALDRARLHIDLDQLDHLLACAEADSDPQTLGAALALWRGKPLEGSDFAWADGDIRHLTGTFLGLLERAGRTRLDRSDARGALQMAEQAIALDQFHEASWRLALEAEHVLGLRESITKRYDELTNALDRELGLRPDPETRRVVQRALGQT